MIVRLLDWLNRRGKAAAVRGMALRGYGRVHPKHVAPGPTSRWYLDHIGPEDRVLDLGCGLGYHTEAAARVARVAIGLDANADFVRRAQDRVAVRFSVHDLRERLPFEGASWTVVLALDILEHLDDRIGALREMRRVLTTDGRLLLVVPNRSTRWRRRLCGAGVFSYSDPDHRIEYVWPELVNELTSAGFRVDGPPRPLVYDTPWAGLIDCTATLSLGLYRRLSRWRVDMARRHPSETVGWAVVARPE